MRLTITLTLTALWGIWVALHLFGIFEYDALSVIFPTIFIIGCALALDKTREALECA